MKIKLALLVLLSTCLSGCLTWNVDKQAVANAAGAAAGAAVGNAAANAAAPDKTPAKDETPKEPKRKGYVPDPNDPMKGPPRAQANIQEDDPYYAPVEPDGLKPAQAPNGSIYRTGMGDVMYGDQRASKVGDILTVNLNESTSSTKDNAATISKTSSATGDNPTVLGQKIRADSTLPQQKTNFSGSASANQDNSLTGTITVTVYQTYPNGLLAIRGEKWLRLNQGDEYIRFTGLVRKADVSPQNTVDSSRVADARITYSGNGDVAAGSQQGWVTRLLNSSDAPR